MYWHLKFHRCFMWKIESKRIVKTKTRDVFDDGSGPLCCNDDIDTYCENVPCNINDNNMVSDNIGLA